MFEKLLEMFGVYRCKRCGKLFREWVGFTWYCEKCAPIALSLEQ